MSEKQKTLHMKINPVLKKRLRRAAEDRDITMAQLVELAIREYLAK